MREEKAMVNHKHTSPRIAELAAKTLCNPKASKRDKALAGSALAQAGKAARTKAPARAAAA